MKLTIAIITFLVGAASLSFMFVVPAYPADVITSVNFDPATTDGICFYFRSDGINPPSRPVCYKGSTDIMIPEGNIKTIRVFSSRRIGLETAIEALKTVAGVTQD